MAMNLANVSNQNFYIGTSSEFSSWSESFDFTGFPDSDIVLFMELDTKVIHYNYSASGVRQWAIFGADEQSPDEL